MLYTDDLKLIGRIEEELSNEIRIVKTTGNDIKVEFGFKKCARVSLKSAKVHRKQHIETEWRKKLKN